jgi:hypothetical protein
MPESIGCGAFREVEGRVPVGPNYAGAAWLLHSGVIQKRAVLTEREGVREVVAGHLVVADKQDRSSSHSLREGAAAGVEHRGLEVMLG